MKCKTPVPKVKKALHDIITDSVELQNDHGITYWKGCGMGLFYIGLLFPRARTEN
jgi:hypothetical protein